MYARIEIPKNSMLLRYFKQIFFGRKKILHTCVIYNFFQIKTVKNMESKQKIVRKLGF